MGQKALYRLYRPQNFNDLVGQEHVTTTLKNALETDQLSHAYLFSGPRGTGKTSAAKILSKALNCEQSLSPEPCNKCDSCKGITDGSALDVLEIDAASNRGIDEIRDLRDKLKYIPTGVKYKVYIIDEVHMLTTEAFNALLKMLEEPPSHVVFILATTEPNKLPVTVVSRCQRFSFKRIFKKEIISRLEKVCEEQNINTDGNALSLIASLSDGGMRDALSLLDQAASYGSNSVTEDNILQITGSSSRSYIIGLLEDIGNKNLKGAIEKVDKSLVEGIEPREIIRDLSLVSRDIMINKLSPDLVEDIDVELFAEASNLFSLTDLIKIIDKSVEYQQKMKFVSHPQIILEVLLGRLCLENEANDIEKQHETKPGDTQLEERVKRLEGLVSKKNIHPHRELASQTFSKEQASHLSLSIDKESVSDEMLEKVLLKWGEILNKVKSMKITVHAWLVGGRVVGVTNDTVIIAFKSELHCRTMERKENKELVEGALYEILKTSYKLRVIMQDEWSRLTNNSTAKEGTKVKDSQKAIDKAIEVFGEDVVQIKE